MLGSTVRVSAWLVPGKISVEMTTPRYMPLIAYAEAWTPSPAGVLRGRVVYIGNKTVAEVEAMSEQLRGAIVLTALPQTQFLDTDRPQPGLTDEPVRTGNPPGASVGPSLPPANFNDFTTRWSGRYAQAQRLSGWNSRCARNPDCRVERHSFDRCCRGTVQHDRTARIQRTACGTEVELRTRYYEDDPRTYNVIAEIPERIPRSAMRWCFWRTPRLLAYRKRRDR